MRVRDPDGQTWRVTRRWVPWRPRPRMIGPRLWLLFEGPLVFVVLLVIGLVVLPVVSVG